MLHHPYFRHPGVMVIAHRGGGGLAPENTLPAFRHAVAMGVDGLELDVHSTRDGVIVVSHDAEVDRVTDGQGPIQAYTWDELQQLDAGYRWRADGGRTFPFRGQGVTIPRLADVFTAFPEMPISIDIKQREPDIVAPFARLIREHGMASRVMVGSFHNETVDRFRQAMPGVVTACSLREVRRFYAMHRLRLARWYRGAAEGFPIPEHTDTGRRVITPRFVRDLHRHGIHLHVWTVNESEAMRRLISWGVDGLITDYPDRLMNVLGRPIGPGAVGETTAPGPAGQIQTNRGEGEYRE